MKEKLQTLRPEADKKLYTKILKTVYDNRFLALLELIDNSIDAFSTKISIENKNDTIEIKDNGIGIPLIKLENALRLAYSDTYNQFSIGNYGVGLTSGCMALTTKDSLIVIKTTSCDSLTSTLETLEIHWNPHNDPNKFDVYRIDTESRPGTTITIYNSKPLYNGEFTLVNRKSKKPFDDWWKIKNILGLYYYKSLDRNPDLSIKFNNLSVEKFDPLYRDSEYSVITNDKINIGEYEITLICSLIDKDEPKHNWWDQSGSGWRQHAAGIYVVAGGRYINLGNGFGDSNIPLHGRNQRVRMELLIPRELYELIGVNFSKLQFQITDDIPELRTLVSNMEALLRKIDGIVYEKSKIGHPRRTTVNEIKEQLSNNTLDNYFKNPKNSPSKLKKERFNNNTTDSPTPTKPTTDSPKPSVVSIKKYNKKLDLILNNTKLKRLYSNLDGESKKQVKEWVLASLPIIDNDSKHLKEFIVEYIEIIMEKIYN